MQFYFVGLFGRLTGPAVLAVSGGVQEFSTLRIFGVTGKTWTASIRRDSNSCPCRPIISSRATPYRYAADGERTEITERAASAGAGYGDPANLRTERIYHLYGRTSTSGRLKSVSYPDGRKDTYTYEQGAYTDSADPSLSGGFIPGAGDDVRASVVYGAEAHSKGVPYKTTKEVTISDRTGHTLQEESYVYTGIGYERIGWTIRVLDGRGRPETEYRSDGTKTETVWGCCNRAQTVDARGMVTDYGHDGLDRLEYEIRESLEGPIRTDYIRAVEDTGRVETRTVAGGGRSLSTVARYDRAGRTFSTTDAAGLTTGYAYNESVRVQRPERGGFLGALRGRGPRGPGRAGDGGKPLVRIRPHRKPEEIRRGSAASRDLRNQRPESVHGHCRRNNRLARLRRRRQHDRLQGRGLFLERRKPAGFGRNG